MIDYFVNKAEWAYRRSRVFSISGTVALMPISSGNVTEMRVNQLAEDKQSTDMAGKMYALKKQLFFLVRVKHRVSIYVIIKQQ